MFVVVSHSWPTSPPITVPLSSLLSFLNIINYRLAAHHSISTDWKLLIRTLNEETAQMSNDRMTPSQDASHPGPETRTTMQQRYK